MSIQYKYHDIANMYPMAMPDEFQQLVASIRDRGQIHPIIIFEDKILDGRNRYKACLELEIEPKVEIFDGSYDDALQYSTEFNSARRNLDKSQKAMVAAYAVEKSRLQGQSRFTIKEASRVYGVSDKHIKDAMWILNKNEKIATQVFDGEETIYRAKKRIDDIEVKYSDIDFIEADVSNNSINNELSDTYSFLYSKDKKELVDIIVKNKYLNPKTGTNSHFMV